MKLNSNTILLEQNTPQYRVLDKTLRDMAKTAGVRNVKSVVVASQNSGLLIKFASDYSEAANWLINDEGLYNETIRIVRRSYNTSSLAQNLEEAFKEVFENIWEKYNVDEEINWYDLAEEVQVLFEEEEEESSNEIKVTVIENIITPESAEYGEEADLNMIKNKEVMSFEDLKSLLDEFKPFKISNNLDENSITVSTIDPIRDMYDGSETYYTIIISTDDENIAGYIYDNSANNPAANI